MSDPASKKVTRLEELARDIQPPRDGWPALEAQLRGTSSSEMSAAQHDDLRRSSVQRSGMRRSVVWLGAVAAAVAAIAAGIFVDRLLLQAGSAGAGRQLAARQAPSDRIPGEPEGATPGTPRAELPAIFINDPRYLAERAALLASLDERLKSLPPQTRQQVLASLATIHRSMQQIQQALGREPTNALLQGLLIDTYQDEMRVLTAVQEAGAGGGES